LSQTIPGVYTVSVTGLTANTTYHYRGYAINSTGIAFTSDATFTTLVPTYTLTITKLGTGASIGNVTSSPSGINCGTGSNCSANFNVGSIVILTETPGSNNAFIIWGGGLCWNSTPTCTVTMNNPNLSVTAEFLASAPGGHWHVGGLNQSCNTACASYGGCNPANWNDDTSCTALKSSLSPQGTVCLTEQYTASAPEYGWNGSGQMIYRNSTLQQNCALQPLTNERKRLCSCNN